MTGIMGARWDFKHSQAAERLMWVETFQNCSFSIYTTILKINLLIIAQLIELRASNIWEKKNNIFLGKFYGVNHYHHKLQQAFDSVEIITPIIFTRNNQLFFEFKRKKKLTTLFELELHGKKKIKLSNCPSNLFLISFSCTENPKFLVFGIKTHLIDLIITQIKFWVNRIFQLLLQVVDCPWDEIHENWESWIIL